MRYRFYSFFSIGIKKWITSISKPSAIEKRTSSEYALVELGASILLRCRPNSQPFLVMKCKQKQIIVTEVGKTLMDDFERDEEEAHDKEVEVIQEVQEPEAGSEVSATNNSVEAKEEVDKKELKIEDIIEPGRYGVSNSQMIPAMKKAIAENSIEKLVLLKSTYFYTFDRSIRYLKKAEREYITTNLK